MELYSTSTINHIYFILISSWKTFKYTANGPEGLVGGKKVVVLGARGSDYSSEQMAPMEMAVNYNNCLDSGELQIQRQL